MLLSEDESGERKCMHASMVKDPPVFALLASAVPILRELQDKTCTATSMTGEAHKSTIEVAVIGAGAGTVPSALVARHKDVQVVAVDIDAGVSARSFCVRHPRLVMFMACNFLTDEILLVRLLQESLHGNVS
jgi:hypothetical protein